MTIAKRELASVFPLLKPTRKLLAEVTPYYEADEEGAEEKLLVMSSEDESTYFDSIEAELESSFERITGERLTSLR